MKGFNDFLKEQPVSDCPILSRITDLLKDLLKNKSMIKSGFKDFGDMANAYNK